MLTTEFWVQMVVYGVSVGTFAGIVLTRLKYLEKKMDKHNNVVARLAVNENSTKVAHNRIDDCKEEFKELCHELRQAIKEK